MDVDDEMHNKDDSNSSSSVAANTGDTARSKVKLTDQPKQKSSRKLTQQKIKDEQSVNEASEKSEEETKEAVKERKLVQKKEKRCIAWMKALARMKTHQHLHFEESSSDDTPEYCYNKSCPISEIKIPQTTKVLNMAKKVVLRKVLFENHDERWYCLK